MRIEIEMLLIGLGGAIGALSRYGIAEFSKRVFSVEFPLGTLIANLVGCFLIGVLLGSGHADKSDPIRLGLGIGFLGSLTTFSTFSAETVTQINSGNWLIAFSNVGISLGLGLILVFVGMVAGKKLAN
ncbi:MAG: fluoride efflux transporter CrcB [Mariniblastus sp.]